MTCLSTASPWHAVVRKQTDGITTLAEATAAIIARAAAYGQVTVETLTAEDYLLLYPTDGVIERRKLSSPDYARAVSGSCWAAAVWDDPDFLAANETLRAAEDMLEGRLVAFAVTTTRGFLEDPDWLAMIAEEARARGMTDADFERGLARARRDATAGLASGWVSVRAGDLLDFFRQLDRWRKRTGKLHPHAKETST